MSGSASALTFAQTFFVPLTDTDLQASWQAIGTGATIGSSIKSVISIAVPKAGTLIYYDQWEDGYDANPAAPALASTQIWGDGNTSNGAAPGYATDIVPAGGVIVLNNSVTLPRVATSLFYDGRDRISTTNTIAVARVGWPIDPGPVIGTSAEAYDTRKFGTSFQMPVGTLTGSYQQFEYASLHIMASQDGTLVQVDTNADGTVDQTQTLNMGQTMFVNGGVQVGATVTASKPVEVHEVTGDIGSTYESRTFAVRPTAQWSSGYFAPVTTTAAAQPHVVVLYNPGARAISVSYEGLSTTGTIAVPSKGNATFNMPLNSAVHFFTVSGEAFYAVGANDAGATTTGANQSQDWGYALMPDTSLTTSIIAPFAPGADDTAAPLGTPDANGSPIWVTPTSTTTVYVNYGGDRATGPNTAPDGSKYDVSYLVPKLGVRTIYNPTTFDMSKSVIFTTDSTGLAGGWGEDPATSGTGLPYLDLGYAIIPFSAPIFSKFAALSTDVNANGVIDQGDSVLFTLFLNNDGVTSLVNPAFTDALPAGTSYIPNSTVLNGVPVADDAAGTPFPLDGAGVSPPDLVPGASATVKFRVSINAGTKQVTNTAQANSSSVSAPMLASVTFPVSPVLVTGNVYNDANGLTDGIVNGTATNAGGALYANIVGDGVVQQVYLVDPDGTFRFLNIPGNSNYTVLLSTTRGTLGSSPPAASLPAGYASTGENLGLGVANDGTADGALGFSVATTNVANANFGIEHLPVATAATAASQANPGGTAKVTVPTLSGTDTEDASITAFIINTLPSNGILYYNGVAVTAGQTLVSYSAALLKLDPNDGAITATFTCSAVDAALKSSAPVTVTMPFTTVGVSGTVYDDADGTTNNRVDGTGSNAGGALYVNLVTGGNVAQVRAVAADGTFDFLTVPAATYTVVLSTTQGTVGSSAPAAALPAGYVTTAEKLGTGTGNDGTADGTISVTVNTTSVANARFGFDRLPDSVDVTAASQANPAGNTKVAVPAIGGTDPEDGTATTVVLNTLGTNGTLYYNNSSTTAGQTITNFNPALLTIDPAGNTAVTLVASFTYSVKDAAGLLSPASTVTMPFTGSGISIFGNVFNDANGLSDSIVNGTGTNAGGLFAVLASGGLVSQSVVVGSSGAYVFPSVSANTGYTVTLSTTAGTVGGAPPAVSLPAGYVDTGEFIGTVAGNDGVANGSLAVAVTTANISNANFGVDRTPAASALTATLANPGGSTLVNVPTLAGSDPEDGALSRFVINTLPANGTLYYNGIAATLGQVITGYNPTLLKLDPDDGAITVGFTYSAVDAAGASSPAVSCTVTFTSIGISGTVFDDANGLTDSTVNGTGTNAGASLHANLVSGGNVAQTVAVAGNGTYSFGTVAPNTAYTVVLSASQGTVGSAAPAAVLPAGYVNTGEFIGTAAGNDGSANGSLIVATSTGSIANVNFGIDAVPVAVSISDVSRVNPSGTAQVAVPPLAGTDPEDGSITKFTILSLPANGTLYYDNTVVTVGQVITGYTASLLKFDPVDGALTATFNYAAIDAAGKASAPVSVTMPFTSIGITGIVFNDINGLSDSIVNGTGTNAGNTLYANLVSGGLVVQVQEIQLAGTYNFLTVVGGTTYTVVISTTQGGIGSAAPAAALPAGYAHTGEFIGATAGNDGAANGSLVVAVATASVSNANFGIREQADVTGHLYIDTNGNGTRNVGEPALAGVDVLVTDVFGSTQTVTSNASGNWTASVPPGDCTADVQESDPQYPADCVRTEGTDPTTSTAVAGGIANGGTDGFFLLGSITGSVLSDTNGDGGGDAPLAGVVIRLLNNVGAPVLDGFGAPVTTTTLADGSYRFGNLPPGNYCVVEDQPANYGSVSDTDGANDNVIGNVTAITVSAGAAAGGNNFVDVELGVISGYVLLDTDNNGSGDAPLPGVVMNLLNGSGSPVLDGLGAPVQVASGAGGFYSFTLVPTGSYRVSQNQPVNYGSVSDVDGANNNVIGDETPVVMTPGLVVADRNFVEIQLGAISGSVTANGNPLAGITLALLDPFGNPVLDGSGHPVTTVTGSDGSYIFTGVRPGSYKIRQTQPFGYNSFGDGDGGDPDLIGDVVPVTVLPGLDNSANNFIESLDTCPDTWAEWEFQHPGELSSENPDGDALDNLAEFAFAKSATSGAGDAWLIRPAAGNTIEGVFTRPKGAWRNVIYHIEHAGSLASPLVWVSFEIIPAMVSVVDNGDCTETVTIHDLETLTGMPDGTGFVRIRADLDEDNDNTIDHSSRTGVEGWKETALALCCRTYNNPFLRSTVFTGTIGAVTGQTLDLANSAGGVDLSTLLAPGVSYYAEVTSGTNAGHRFDIASASGFVLTIAADGDLYSAAPPFNTLAGALSASLAGDEIVIRRHWTLAEMFPPSGFSATDDRNTADQVQLFANGQWMIFWLYDDGVLPARWVRTGDNTYADQGTAVLAPGQGMFFNKRTAATSILAYGEVRVNGFISLLATGSNLVAGGYPIDQAATGPAGRGMTTAAGFFGSRDIATADSFYIWQGDSTAGATGYNTYFLNNNAPRVPSVIKWVKVGDATLLSRDAELLLQGNRSVFLRSKNGVGGYTVPSPWTP